MFENSDAPLMLHPRFENDQRRRIAKSCRPFADDTARVEPVWRQLTKRASKLGFGVPPPPAITGDPDLHLLVAGNRVKPAVTTANRYTFALPVTGGQIRLVSRATRPCELRPWVEDRRLLGVMVSMLTLRHGNTITPIPLDHPSLTDGWWSIERDKSSVWR